MASDAATGDGFGSSSAGLGDYTGSGAPHNGNGVVYVYHRDQGGKGVWGELTTLEVPAKESPGGNDKFGSALAFGEDEETGTQYLAVGAEAHGGCGAVFIFYPLLGCSLAMFGTMLAVGAKNQGGVGAVFIFTLALIGLFTLFQTLAAIGGVAGDAFGYAVSLFGKLLLVGAPKAITRNAIIAGAIFIFLLNAIDLTYASTGDKIIPSTNPDAGMQFGASLVLLGILLFGFAPNYNAGQGAFFLILLAATALTYSTWILLFFAKSLVENVALAHLYGIFGDFDGDGIPNFLEYLMNMLPTVFDVDPLRAIITVAGFLTLLLPVSLITLNALFVIQYSFNMATWFALGLGLLAGILSTRIRYPGITTNILILTMSVALATAINPRFFLRYYGEQQ